MLKNQTVNHVSEHLSAICPVYTCTRGAAVFPTFSDPNSVLFVFGHTILVSA